jgi:organic radical activating enzyme
MSQQNLESLMDDLKKRIAYETNKLIELEWTKTKTGWQTPDKKDIPEHQAYELAISKILEQNGWKTITESRRTGPAHWKAPIIQWARYQSPKTKRVYSFLEAIRIIENESDESIWPNECCIHTIELNKLVGPDFNGTEIKTWFGRTDAYTLELTNADDH